jgi:hypothetical protein
LSFRHTQGVWIVKLTVKSDAGEPFVLDAPIVIER